MHRRSTSAATRSAATDATADDAGRTNGQTKTDALAADTPRTAARSLLRPLGIVGYDAAEPALLAALATEAPLLLVSDHGAAKSLLLERLADTLGLALRHYNASLLQYDDLVGFPVPQDDGSVRFAAPPGAIWGAEALFLDEIGRCRADVANKLFPLVHERRVQGIRIETLRFRWAATNPPAVAQHDDDDTDDHPYAGVEPLDAALADRFDWVVALPRFDELGDLDRAAIVRGVTQPPTTGAQSAVRELVATTRTLLPSIEARHGEAITTYVVLLTAALHRAGLAVGGRRAATFRRNIVAGWAAHLALGRATGEPALAAIVHASIPDRVRRHVPDATLMAAHRQAWAVVTIASDAPEAPLVGETDPVRRALIAATLPGLDRVTRGEAITHAISEVPLRLARILAWLLLRRLGSGTDVPAATLEVLADLLTPAVRTESLWSTSPRDGQGFERVKAAIDATAPSPLVAAMLVRAVAESERARHPFGALPLLTTDAEAHAERLVTLHAEWCDALALDPAAGDGPVLSERSAA